VKHFKWEPRGKRRIHQKPNSREVAACRPWLEAELRVVKPRLLVCLGATVAQAVFGPSFRVTGGARQSIIIETRPENPRYGAPIVSSSTIQRAIAPT
jgi:uracil-DNA glycosylase family 4